MRLSFPTPTKYWYVAGMCDTESFEGVKADRAANKLYSGVYLLSQVRQNKLSYIVVTQ